MNWMLASPVNFYVGYTIVAFLSGSLAIYLGAFMGIFIKLPGLANKSLVYITVCNLFVSVFWPIGIFINLRKIWDGRDLFAELIKYDGSW